MSENRPASTRNAAASPWVIDTRELGRRPGSSRAVMRAIPVDVPLGFADVIEVPAGATVDVDVLLESVVEGVLVSGTASAPTKGECARCLDPLSGRVEVELTELFAYPNSATEETTDEDEIPRLVDDRIDLEPVVRDAVVLALPQVPLCSPDCAGLCSECGAKWAEVGPDHGHEKIDARWAALRERFGESSDRPEEK
ncbi:YceD family protein [Kibdelosporangium lantanae]